MTTDDTKLGVIWEDNSLDHIVQHIDWKHLNVHVLIHRITTFSLMMTDELKFRILESVLV